MKIVEQSVNVWGECPNNIQEAKLWIERAGRTCYNSPMPETPCPDKFLDKVMSQNPPHSSVFEHSNLIVKDSRQENFGSYLARANRWITEINLWQESDGTEPENQTRFYFGNYRAFMEALGQKSINGLMQCLEDLELVVTDPPAREAKRVTVELHTDRNVLAEITRHRNDVAFSVRSQRYVDENKLMEFIKPSWYDDAGFIVQQTFLYACQQAELNYKTLRREFSPQHARTVLNGQVKTVIIMTAYLPQWDWIFRLRRASNAYPQMILLMNMVYDRFLELGYVESD